ncbi:type II toxin-antitoxin system VapC family toxin [Bacteroidales bacterium OttesenSCG-928-I21]|nr:type II toxin-antitoxin system VapC family toxin [Bacteroidales bacterium OttesenSCG-928-I21]
MKRYLLDTHILIWLLNGDERLNKNLREDIDYFQHPYYVSVESLREIVILQSLKKIKFDFSVEKVAMILTERLVEIINIDINHIKALEKLPVLKINGKEHEDPFDRLLIAQSIADKFTIISSDSKFPFYKDSGLKLLINEK